MAKQSVTINFSKGLDQKTDPKQIQVGKFLSLKNSVFNSIGALTKRNGFPQLSILPQSASYLTTFNNDLAAIGNSLQAYVPETENWVNKGTIQPISVSTLPILRNSITQTQCDSAVAPNGFVCTVFVENNGTSNQSKVMVSDSTTGQIVYGPAGLGALSPYGAPRVFVIGIYFIVLYATTGPDLSYLAISYLNPGFGNSSGNISTSYAPATTGAFDAVVYNNNLIIAWNGASSSGIKMATLSYLLVVSSTVIIDASHQSTIMSVTADQGTGDIWVAYYNSGSSTGYAVVVDQNLNIRLSATQFISSGSFENLSAVAIGGKTTIFEEVSNSYSYDSSIPSNYIQYRTITNTGTVGSATVVLKSLGLASKAFFLNSVPYMLATYQSPYQNTYFLIGGNITNGNRTILAKLAYGNGGGYLPTGLPNVSVNGSLVQIPYLFKDLVASVNKGTNLSAGTQTAGIYSQTGVNLASFNFSPGVLDTAEIGSNLNFSGGFLWSYDGNVPVEQNFFLYPDSVELTALADPAPTANTSSSSTPTVLTSVSSVAGIVVGMNISGTGIPANTTVVAVGTTTITMSNAATATNSGVTVTFTGNLSAQKYFVQCTYEWTDNQGNAHRSAPSIPVSVTLTSGHTSIVINVPYCRVTYKANIYPCKVVAYRWSAAQQSYYQTTSISQPIINVAYGGGPDSVAITDINSDAQILGNNLIYTTGGVLEDTNAPASNILTLFDTRLWMVDAENPNQLWFSKPVLQGTPVEMSDFLTYFVAPNAGTTTSTGPITAMAPMDDKLILFKKDAIFYVNGTGPDATGANSQYSQPIYITSTVGCVNQQSIVLMSQGLMFQSDKGIWLLDRGLNVSYIGAAVQGFNSFQVLSAINVPATNEVRFTLSNGETLSYDYYVNEWSTFDGIPGISSTIYQNLHTFIDKFGRVFQEKPGTYLDGSNPVLMSFLTGQINLATMRGYERIYEYSFLGQYFSPHLALVNTGYDYGPLVHSSTYVPPNFVPAYGGAPYYGDGIYGGTNIEEWRVQTKIQTCKAFQISFQEQYDPSMGVPAGQGISLSGLNMVVLLKRTWAPVSGRNSIG